VPASTVSQYIAAAKPPQRKALKSLRSTIRKAAPKATERLRYGIPVFEVDGKYLLYIAAFRQHVSMYPVTTAMAERHGKALAPYRHGRGTLRFALDEPLPLGLVAKLSRTRVAERRR
jgi:uncharacterized protein YdhG (YjbR/CyaY superfamily)